MNCIKIIKSKRSVRKYKKITIDESIIQKILEAGRWAPSGLSNQPWRFILIKNQSIKQKLSLLTHESDIITGSDFCVTVFYHKPSGYHRNKDLMSIGAPIENMILYAHDERIGTVWLGEILKNGQKVSNMLNVDNTNELTAIIAFGYPDESPASNRLPLEQLLLKTI